MLEERMDLLSGLRLLGEGVERLENYVHVELSEVTCCLAGMGLRIRNYVVPIWSDLDFISLEIRHNMDLH
jgi:hypothetical protein